MIAEIWFTRDRPPVGDGYMPHLVAAGTAEYLGVRFVHLLPMAAGQHQRCEIIFPYDIDYTALRPGRRFAIMEGSRAVGEGVVQPDESITDASWAALCKAMQGELPYAPQFAYKAVGSSHIPAHDPAAPHWGYTWWDELGRVRGGVRFCQIEWMLIRGYRIKALHKYAPPEILDFSVELRSVLDRLGLPYQERDRVFTVFSSQSGDHIGCECD